MRNKSINPYVEKNHFLNAYHKDGEIWAKIVKNGEISALLLPARSKCEAVDVLREKGISVSYEAEKILTKIFEAIRDGNTDDYQFDTEMEQITSKKKARKNFISIGKQEIVKYSREKTVYALDREERKVFNLNTAQVQILVEILSSDEENRFEFWIEQK